MFSLKDAFASGVYVRDIFCSKEWKYGSCGDTGLWNAEIVEIKSYGNKGTMGNAGG